MPHERITTSCRRRAPPESFDSGRSGRPLRRTAPARSQIIPRRMRPEYRKHRRRLISHGARIVLADGSASESRRLIDISGTGARLQIENLDAVPDQFILLLSYDGHLRRQCSVVWRSKKAIGVEFIPNYPAS